MECYVMGFLNSVVWYCEILIVFFWWKICICRKNVMFENMYDLNVEIEIMWLFCWNWVCELNNLYMWYGWYKNYN